MQSEFFSVFMFIVISLALGWAALIAIKAGYDFVTELREATTHSGRLEMVVKDLKALNEDTVRSVRSGVPFIVKYDEYLSTLKSFDELELDKVKKISTLQSFFYEVNKFLTLSREEPLLIIPDELVTKSSQTLGGFQSVKKLVEIALEVQLWNSDGRVRALQSTIAIVALGVSIISQMRE